MKVEIKKKWVDALRSGRYHQVREVLATPDNGRCALGVLCDIAAEEGIVSRRESTGENNRGDRIPCYAYDNWLYGLPGEIITWARLSLNDTCIIASMNDNGASFEEIAKWIEEKL